MDNFVRNLAKYEFLVKSFEFDIFLRSSGPDLEKQMAAMLKVDPYELFKTYQNICPITTETKQ